MRKLALGLIWLLLAYAAAYAADEQPVDLPKMSLKTIVNFDKRPQRNIAFTVRDDATTAYRLTHQLLLELDYEPTANVQRRGDRIGPWLSKRRFGRGTLAETAMVRFVERDDHVVITVRGLFVVPDKEYLLDQTDRRPTKSLRAFAEMYAAKRQLVEQTGEFKTDVLLADARQNLQEQKQLPETAATLKLIKQSTHPRCQAGRQARELLHAVEEQIKRRERLMETLAVQQDRIAEAMAARDWLTAHRETDRLHHVLLGADLPEDDPLFAEAKRSRDALRRRLRARGAVHVFNPRLAPADGDDVAVGFTALNAGTRAVASIQIKVTTFDREGQPSPGRIGRGHVYTVEFDPPLAPNEYLGATVVTNFEHPTDATSAKVRLVGLRYAKK